MEKNELVPAPVAFRELALKHRTANLAPRSFHEKIIGGLIPAEYVRGRYYIRRADLRLIEASLGLRQQAA